MTATTTTYRSFYASMGSELDFNGKVHLCAWPFESEADPIGILGGVREDFDRHAIDDMVAWLVEKGCDPMHAQFMVKTSQLGKHKVEVYPSEGRVDVGNV